MFSPRSFVVCAMGLITAASGCQQQAPPPANPPVPSVPAEVAKAGPSGREQATSPEHAPATRDHPDPSQTDSELPQITPAPVKSKKSELAAIGQLDQMGVELHQDQTGHVLSISTRGINADDDVLTAAADCPQLEVLELTGADITDDGLKHLSRLSNLRNLDLQGTRITNTGLGHLKGMMLTSLDLRSTQVTDQGLTVLTTLSELKDLSVGDVGDGSFSLKFGPDGRPMQRPNVPEDRVSKERLTDEGLKVIRTLKELTSLNISGAQLTPQAMPGFADLTKLTRLDLDRCTVGDAVESIGTLKELTFLSLSETGITDAGVKQLLGLTQLTWLDLSGNAGITNEALGQLKDLVSLETVSLKNTKITDDGVAQLKTLKSLQNLFLKGTAVTRKAATALRRQLPRLGMVETSDLEEMSGDPNSMPRFPEVEKLGGHVSMIPNVQVGPAWAVSLADKPIRDEDLPILNTIRDEGFGYLSLVDLQKTKITDDAFKQLPSPDTLEALHVGQTAITGAEFGRLAKVPNFKILIASDCPITDVSLSALKDVAQLQSLDVSGTSIAGSTLGELADLESFRILNVARTNVDDTALAAIARLPNLQGLDLSGTKVTKEGLTSLGEIEKLQSLELNKLQIGGPAIKRLAALEGLRWLGLNDVQLDDAAADALALLPSVVRIHLSGDFPESALQSIGTLNSLQHLDLGGSHVTDASLKHLTNLRGIRIVRITNAPVTGSGLVELKAVRSLRVLELTKTEWKGAGWAELGELSQLSMLNLNDSDLDDAGLEACCDKLQVLGLRIARTKVTTAGLKSLAKLDGLRALDLEGVALTEDAIDSLANLRTLQQLDLTDTGLSEKTLDQLRSKLRRCLILPTPKEADDAPQ